MRKEPESLETLEGNGKVDYGRFQENILISDLHKFVDIDGLMRNIVFVINHMKNQEFFTSIMRRVISDRYIRGYTWKQIQEHIDPSKSIGYFHYHHNKALPIMRNELERIALTSPIQTYILKMKRISPALEILYDNINRGITTTTDFLLTYKDMFERVEGVTYANLFKDEADKAIALTMIAEWEYNKLADALCEDVLRKDSYVALTYMIREGVTKGTYSVQQLQFRLEQIRRSMVQSRRI